MAAMPARAQLQLGQHELGLTVGGMNYIGDLNDQTVFDKPCLGIGGFYRLNFNDRWSLRVDIDYGHVENNSDYIERRNLSFRSYIFEGSIRAEFNFFPYKVAEEIFPFVWTPYIFGGVGFFAFNPKAYLTNPITGESAWHELQPLATEGQGTNLNPDSKPYTLKQINFPFGVGIKYNPSKSFTISVEYGFRKTLTDYIDDVSTDYVDNNALSTLMGQEAAWLADRSGEVEPGYVNPAGMQRGDDSLDDWYAYFNVSVSVSFDILFGWLKKKRCDIK